MNLQVVKITRKNDQAWLTCHIDGKYVALLHIIDKKLATKIHNPKSITLDTSTIADTPGVVFANKPKASAKLTQDNNSKWDAFDAALGRSDHSKPLPKSRFKDKFTNWSGYPYQHKT